MRRAALAVKRNREPIAAVLDDELPVAGLVLEIASGTGEHGLHFARRWPAMLWQPSDPDPMARASIEAWRSGGPENLLPPLALDAARPDWPLDRSDAIVCINMTHISPPAATRGLFGGAGRLLGAGCAARYLWPVSRRRRGDSAVQSRVRPELARARQLVGAEARGMDR